MGATVVVATFGDESWAELARQRALPSALEQAPVVHAHRATLAEARNAGVASVESEWVIHLDADDELEPGYVAALLAGTADMRAPAVRYVSDNGEMEPRVPLVVGHNHACTADCLQDGNWMVVGTMVRAQAVRDVGGWRDWPLYEDWDLFLRMYRAGQTAEAVPGAVYRAHVRPRSRNEPPMRVKRDTWRRIVEANR